MVKLKVDPSPGLLRTEISPTCFSTKSRQMISPSPVPFSPAVPVDLNPARALASPSSQARFPAALLRGLASTNKINTGSKISRSSASRFFNYILFAKKCTLLFPIHRVVLFGLRPHESIWGCFPKRNLESLRSFSAFLLQGF